MYVGRMAGLGMLGDGVSCRYWISTLCLFCWLIKVPRGQIPPQSLRLGIKGYPELNVITS